MRKRTARLGFLLAALAAASPAWANSEIMILHAPPGLAEGRVAGDPRIYLRRGEHLSLIDQEGRLVRVDGPFDGRLSERIGSKPESGSVRKLFDTIAALFSSEAEDRSAMGAARGDETGLRELTIDGRDQSFCIVDDSPLVARLSSGMMGDTARYDFTYDTNDQPASIILGPTLPTAGWSYRGGKTLVIWRGETRVQSVRIADLRTISGDMLLLAMSDADCTAQLPAFVASVMEAAQ